jgi:hypothetical protein
MSNRARLSELKKTIDEPTLKPKKNIHKKLDANIPRGERADFLKITVTMPAEMLSKLKEFGMRRKTLGEKDTDTSALIRKAVAEYLEKKSTD